MEQESLFEIPPERDPDREYQQPYPSPIERELEAPPTELDGSGDD